MPRTAAIIGRVTDESGQPLRKARVVLAELATLEPARVLSNGVLLPPPPPPRTDETPPPVAFTDNDGRFSLTGLEPGRYTVSVRKAGFVPTTYGARHAGEPPIGIDLETGGRATVAVRMPRSAGISGRILDQYGEPVEGALVSAERFIRSEGRISTRPAGTATTDDLGEYRIGALTASRYAISAYINRNAPNVTFFVNDSDGVVNPELLRIPGMSQVRTYFPGVLGLSNAEPIDVRAGEERASVDVAVPADTAFPTLTLSFFDAEGKPVPGDATLANLSGAIPRFMPVPARNPKIAARVEPGDWTVLARGNNGLVGMTQISVTSGDASASITLGRGGRLSGRIESDGAQLPNARLAIAAVHPSDDASTRWGTVQTTRPDGTFQLNDLLGPLVIRVPRAATGWAIKSITYNGRDVSDTPIEFKPTTAISGVRVLMTSRTATLEGLATDAQGAALAEYSVLVFPEDRALAAHPRRYARWARPNQQGRFAIDDLLAADYLAIAVTDVDDTQWQNADYLERFRAQATRVTLGESEKKRIVLPLITQ